MADEPIERKKRKLVDPELLIKGVRDKMNPKCAVRQSKYCDIIISMRMQGMPYLSIEKWLIGEGGDEARISETTIYRNLKTSGLEVNLSYAEHMVEVTGGRLDLDLVREMSQNIYTQKQRIDKLVRREVEINGTRKPIEAYLDKRIRPEMETLNKMVKDLHIMIQERDLASAADGQPDVVALELTEDAASMIAELIVSGSLVIDASAVVNPERDVRGTKTLH